jgi:hypothetical protein
MKHKKLARSILGFLFLLFLLVLVSFLLWFFGPKKELNVFILDKTVPSKERKEHKSFHWVLNHNRYVKENQKRYRLKEDYYGFFPINAEKEQFDFKSVSLRDVESISRSVDFAYFADTYGVYYNDWYQKTKSKVRSEQKVYGDLNQNDYLLLKELINKGKTIVTEFVLLNKTTSGLVREKTEDLLKFHWEGWLGRYFHSLDTLKNPDFPNWIVELYNNQNKQKWSFRNDGIVLIHKYGKIVVLDASKHLKEKGPTIHSNKKFAEKYHLPQTITYPYWFDIVKSNNPNHVSASFHIPANSYGDSILAENNLSTDFPAIINHSDNYSFYYFAGDFCQNPIYTTTSFFKGIRAIDFFFYSEENPDRAEFFWKYYIPLMEGILEDTYSKVH